MDIKKEVKRYFNKYFKQQFINENDNEFKELVRLLNKSVNKNSVKCNVSDSVNYHTELEEILQRRFGNVIMSGSLNDREIRLVDTVTKKSKARIVIIEDE